MNVNSTLPSAASPLFFCFLKKTVRRWRTRTAHAEMRSRAIEGEEKSFTAEVSDLSGSAVDCVDQQDVCM